MNNNQLDMINKIELWVNEIFDTYILVTIETIMERSVEISEIVGDHKVLFHMNTMRPEIKRRLIIPHLCFEIDNGQINRLGEKENIEELYNEFKRHYEIHDKKDVNVYLMANIVIIFKNKTEKYGVIVSEYLKYLNMFFISSYYRQNMLQTFGYEEGKKINENEFTEFSSVVNYAEKSCGLNAFFTIQFGGDGFYNTYVGEKGIYNELLDIKTKLSKKLESDIKYVFSKRKKTVGLVRLEESKFYYIVLPCIYRSLGVLVIRGVLVVFKDTPLSMSIVSVVENLIEKVLDRKYISGQSNLIRELQESSVRGVLGGAGIIKGNKERKTLVRKFGDLCVQGIVRHTPAISATIRLFDPFDKALKLECISFIDEIGGYLSGQAKEYYLSDWETSVNVFTFCKMRKGEYVHLPDVRHIPKEYREIGLKNVSKERNFLCSEICFPIYARHIAIGVLNVEASFLGAFSAQTDRMFVRTICKAFSDYYTGLQVFTDTNSLSSLSFRHIAFHRAEGFAAKLGDDALKQDFRMIINSLENPYDRCVALQGVGFYLRSVVDELRDYAISIQQSIDPINIVENNVPGDVQISSSFAESLRVIGISLLDNARQHSVLDKEKVSFRYLKTTHRKFFKGELSIEYKSRSMISASKSDQAFLVPISAEVTGGQRTHLGLFLIGVHARLLGGVCHVYEAKESVHLFNFVIRLPVS
ncbi:MAG: hypothetical protein HQM04_09015 [Magnetococcales bacterium]|nr:hypothetical protein [Magnetococcales bacterium]MBF0115174.1 hypothetical protein [Magnetococcales bacterium]